MLIYGANQKKIHLKFGHVKCDVTFAPILPFRRNFTEPSTRIFLTATLPENNVPDLLPVPYVFCKNQCSPRPRPCFENHP